MFDELFSPGRKHTDEERKRLELTRVDLNDGDPGRGPIDLTSGKVVVRVPAQASPEPAAEPEPVPEPASEARATPKPGPDPSHDSAPDLDPTVPSDDQS
ncbi:MULTISPECIES: DUF6191 domain-containing protein [unclassified Streptomyces]|uniref:DUF6191 domain-containing protein n=1 Tax=unclassified Streptomyces TaxID=2593676 RepID=UPI0036E3A539